MITHYPTLTDKDGNFIYHSLEDWRASNIEHPSPVLSKADFARRFAAGEFGNRTPTWMTLDEFIVGGYEGLCHLRNRIASGNTHYDLRPDEVRYLWGQMQNPGQWYCAAMIPKDVEASLLIQGEVQQTPAWSGRCGLDLYYSQVALPMRQALAKESHQVSGIVALEMLQYYLCPNSMEWMRELLRRYEGHVIEFSTYSKPWGTLPNYNTIFWEVRGGY